MRTALLTGLTAFAVGAASTLALSGTGSAAPAARTSPPVVTASPSGDPCVDRASRAPSCVVERVLTADSAASASCSPTDDDGTPDQGRGDVTTVPAPERTAPGTKLRGDGTVDDTQPGQAGSTAPARAGDDDGTADRSGRRGGDDRDDDRDDRDDRSGREGDDDPDDDGRGGDDDGTADQGSGDR